eukprot:COSAG02_NODE_22742_length_741_cov_1.500000_2_plen_186_part_01
MGRGWMNQRTEMLRSKLPCSVPYPREGPTPGTRTGICKYYCTSKSPKLHTLSIKQLEVRRFLHTAVRVPGEGSACTVPYLHAREPRARGGDLQVPRRARTATRRTRHRRDALRRRSRACRVGGTAVRLIRLEAQRWTVFGWRRHPHLWTRYVFSAAEGGAAVNSTPTAGTEPQLCTRYGGMMQTLS